MKRYLEQINCTVQGALVQVLIFVHAKKTKLDVSFNLL